MYWITTCFILLTASVVAGCASAPRERLYATAHVAGWKLLDTGDGAASGYTERWIRQEESAGDWRSMIIIQFLDGDTRGAAALAESIRSDAGSGCADTRWRVLERGAHSMIYEWKGYDCPGTGSRHELSRIIEGNQGLHRIAYTEKSEAMADENRSYWLNVFRQAYVAQGTRAVVRE